MNKKYGTIRPVPEWEAWKEQHDYKPKKKAVHLSTTGDVDIDNKLDELIEEFNIEEDTIPAYIHIGIAWILDELVQDIRHALKKR